MKIHVIATGEFGHSAAEHFATLVRRAGHLVRIDSHLADPVHHESSWPHAQMRVLFAWRESPALVERLDRSCAETGTPYCTVIMAHPRLQIGPTIIPVTSGRDDAGPGCAKCHQSRLKQHGSLDDRSRALYELYDADPSAGPSGFLPHHPRLAAAHTAGIIAELDQEQGHAVRNVQTTYHVLTNTLSQTTLIPVHGCPRCAAVRADGSWSELAAHFTTRTLESSHV